MASAGRHGQAWAMPMPALLQLVKDRTVVELHRRLEEDGFGGIRFRHGSVFRFIDKAGSRLTDLAERSGVTKQAVGEAVEELERLGYVERASDPGDGRVKIIRLTERGVNGQAAAARILEEIEGRWARHLGGDRVAALRQALEDIASFDRDP